MTQRIAILDGLRSPLCKAGGALASMQADDLGSVVLRELLARLELRPDAIDHVIVGNVAQPPHAANIARIIALESGIPANVVAHTVHHNCASGMRSITDAAMLIATGQAGVVAAGGTESMSAIPLIFNARMTKLFVDLLRARSVRARVRTLASFRPSFLQPIIALKLGLTDPACGLNMGETAEILAREFGVTRREQDAFALESQRKADAAQETGRLADEIMPVIVPPRYSRIQADDDGPRPGVSMESLARLKPYFDRHAGTVTVGNACPITDGAAMVVLASERRAKELGIEPLGWLTGSAYAALDGRRMGLGPVHATAKLLDETGMTMDDFDVIELNEAFAAQVIANERAFASDEFARSNLGRKRAVGAIDHDRLNVNGGAIALGHPVGATGTRLVVTVLKELRRRGGGRGLATLCVGGGQGAALALEAA